MSHHSTFLSSFPNSPLPPYSLPYDPSILTPLKTPSPPLPTSITISFLGHMAPLGLTGERYISHWITRFGQDSNPSRQHRRPKTNYATQPPLLLLSLLPSPTCCGHSRRHPTHSDRQSKPTQRNTAQHDAPYSRKPQKCH